MGSTVVVGTAGHIDHGKSALVRALTGTDPDRLKEEKARGITIDLGFAHLTVGATQLSFVDVPGHERFVRNMLAGAGGIDAVMLVVAANEAVKPQTREHFEICRLLGLTHGVIALTKTDIADSAAVAEATAAVRELVAGSFLELAPIVPVSTVTGEGLETLKQSLAGLAGHGARLHRPGIVRLPIDRVFTVKGFGTVVTGTLVSGRVAVGDALAVLPNSVAVRVRGLQVHGRSADAVDAPQRVAVNLTGASASHLHRGLTLVTPGSLMSTTRADVHITLLASAKPLPHGTRVRAHYGTMEAFARLSVGATRSRDTGAWTPANPGDAEVEIPSGGEAFARLRFESPVVVTRGDRLILRAVSPVATIGGARVLDPLPAGGGVRHESMASRYQLLDTAETGPIVDWMMGEAALRGLDASTLVRRAGLTPDQARAELDARVEAGQAVAAGGRIFARAIVTGLSERAEFEIRKFHRAHPDEAGMPRETLRSQIGRRISLELFDAIVGQLISEGVIKGGERLALPTHTPRETAGGAGARDRFEAHIREGGLTPPDVPVVAGELGLSVSEAERVVRALVQDGRLVRVGDLVFHREPLAKLRADVAGMREGPEGQTKKEPRVTLDVAAFKARHGLSRKFAIPLLEWLDRERVTRRVGDVRIVL